MKYPLTNEEIWVSEALDDLNSAVRSLERQAYAGRLSYDHYFIIKSGKARLDKILAELKNSCSAASTAPHW